MEPKWNGNGRIEPKWQGKGNETARNADLFQFEAPMTLHLKKVAVLLLYFPENSNVKQISNFISLWHMKSWPKMIL